MRVPLKRVAIINPAVLPESTPPDTEIAYVDIGNVESTGTIAEPEHLTFGASPSRARRIVRDGDTIISTVRTYLRAIAFIENQPANTIVSTGFAVLRPVPYIWPKYLFYAVRATPFIEDVVARSVGVSYPAIAPADLSSLHIDLPPLAEQRTIAAYLDREMARIDTIMDARSAELALLNERSQSIIYSVIVNANYPATVSQESVAMLTPLQRYLTLQRGYDLPDRLRSDGTVPVVSSAGPSAFHDRPMVSGPGVVTGRYGTVGDVFYVESDFWPLNTTLYIADFKGNLPRFLYYLLKTLPYDMDSDKSAVPGVNRNVLHRLPVRVPSLVAQRAVVQYLDRVLDQTDRAASRLRQQVRLLGERRQALITAAVTGQLSMFEGAVIG